MKGGNPFVSKYEEEKANMFADRSRYGWLLGKYCMIRYYVTEFECLDIHVIRGN